VSLRVRLTLLTTAITALVVLIGGPAFLTLLDNNADAALSDGLHQRSTALVAVVSTSKQLRLPPARPAGILPPGEDLSQVMDATGQILLTSAAASRPLLPPSQVAAALTGTTTEFIAPVGPWGDLTRVVAVPVRRPSGQQVIAVVGASVGVTANAASSARIEVAVAGVSAVLLSAIAAWLLAGAALRPVDQLRRRAERISEDDTTSRLPIPRGKDEIAALARTLDALVARLQRSLTRERDLIADAGHELRTPLTVLRGELELATRPGRSTSEMSDALHVAAEETDRLVRLANQLLLLAQFDAETPVLQLAVTDLPLLITRATRANSARAQERGVELRLWLDDVPPTVVDRDRVRQIVDNLLDNALRFAPAGSTIDIRLTSDEETAMLEVADTGPGLPEEFLPHAFDRFRCADSCRQRHSNQDAATGTGSGLGLSIVRSLARAHHGDAEAENRPTGGAVVRVTFPLVHTAEESASRLLPVPVSIM
jgi:signal transduction histidine kinase